MDSIRSARWEMIEAGGRTAQSFGLSRLFGQLYILLYLSREPMSLDDMADALGVSKASISISCRQLDSWGVLRKVWKKGDRKDYYVAVTDFSHIFNNGLLSIINKKLASAEIQIQRSIDLLDQGDGAGEDKKFIKERLKQAEEYRSKAEKLLNNPLVRKLV